MSAPPLRPSSEAGARRLAALLPSSGRRSAAGAAPAPSPPPFPGVCE
eukprot:CAMPEP_0182878198 /NCGR_PEP_ID=MMETSP0034_2-20130328/15219_1 /TAXON_ID=156128 /ORGANISM="Nephroselmis pyriformis, Strain CCMP717" /LENGTH=46 /DNA_ID= /DNA_START= /DNA_END= /DNA_ORIENTATION=